ncbi:MAG: hypothetical protein CL933_03005 [Deltaproteobacteria bacterium]|nr:hypothetical protein [Deltaproteobacteria bacterium]
MSDPDSISQILWSSDPTTQRAIWLVLVAALAAAVAVYGPLIVRTVRLFLLERRLLEQNREAEDPNVHLGHDPLREAMLDSPVREAFEEFERRWNTSQLRESPGRSPIRLIDVFDDRPLLAFGPRRSLLPVLPGLFLGLGVLAALTGLIPSLSNPTVSESSDLASGAARSAWMAAQLGLALRVTAWGFLCAIGGTLAGRLIEGSFDARSSGLDALVERAYGSVSPGELAEITRQTQQRGLDTLGRELTRFASELNERLDRGLQRIEQSTARSASLVSQEQRSALHTVVQELSLSVRQGVEHHLDELRGALQRAIEHQTSVTGGLAETFERMVENSQTQDRIARTLIESAGAVEEAARVMRETAGEMQPVLEHLGATSRSLSDTADRIGDTQQVVARTAEGVRGSLEHAASGVDDQRQFIERSLGEIQRALGGLGDGLGDSLQRSLREVDDVLGSTVGQLRDTLAESNETIERLSGPIRAAEGSTRETHLALDRVRTEVEALGQWMNLAVKPLRSGLVDVEGRTEDMTRAITEFTNHARQIDKTMESLRAEIHDESRHLQSAGSELGRRLTQASDAVGLLESTTSDVARRARPESSTGPRERSWSLAPATSGQDDGPPETPARTPPGTSPGPSSPPPSVSLAASHLETSATADGKALPRTPASDALASDDERNQESMGRDLAHSEYRMGSPRAQGPDPYARLEGGPAAPPNRRPFPTRDRKLSNDLKLSGLLGPSGNASERSDDTSEVEEGVARKGRASSAPSDEAE